MSAVLDLPSGPFSLQTVRVMGILNTTPDSFYDGGSYTSVDRALARVHQMVEEGADVIDVGGEKAGPGEPVTAEDEIRRVVPVIEALRRSIELPISVDTMKPAVAHAAMEAGADIINSITGFTDPEMREAAARTGAGVIVMHIKGKPRVANPNPHYEDVVSEVRSFLLARAEECEASGIPAPRIMIDPGPGFGKTTEHDLAVLRGLPALTDLPFPVVLAVSRKKFIGDVLGVSVQDRLDGSLAVAAWGVLNGVKVERGNYQPVWAD